MPGLWPGAGALGAGRHLSGGTCLEGAAGPLPCFSSALVAGADRKKYPAVGVRRRGDDAQHHQIALLGIDSQKSKCFLRLSQQRGLPHAGASAGTQPVSARRFGGNSVCHPAEATECKRKIGRSEQSWLIGTLLPKRLKRQMPS